MEDRATRLEMSEPLGPEPDKEHEGHRGGRWSRTKGPQWGDTKVRQLWNLQAKGRAEMGSF